MLVRVTVTVTVTVRATVRKETGVTQLEDEERLPPHTEQRQRDACLLTNHDPYPNQVPQPCAALCLLFPSQNISQAHREAMRAKRPAGGSADDTPVFFLQQHDDMGNACGTIAAVHAVANAAAVCPTGLEPQPRHRPQTPDQQTSGRPRTPTPPHRP